jgi:hypothetical protein
MIVGTSNKVAHCKQNVFVPLNPLSMEIMYIYILSENSTTVEYDKNARIVV